MSVLVSEEERLKKPWKFQGYPAFSKWMASSEDFLLLRRFGELNARAMLLMQDRIARKEELLSKIDQGAWRGPDDLGDSSSLRHEPRKEREKLMDELIPMLQQYSEFKPYVPRYPANWRRRIPSSLLSGKELAFCAEISSGKCPGLVLEPSTRNCRRGARVRA